MTVSIPLDVGSRDGVPFTFTDATHLADDSEIAAQLLQVTLKQ